MQLLVSVPLDRRISSQLNHDPLLNLQKYRNFRQRPILVKIDPQFDPDVGQKKVVKPQIKLSNFIFHKFKKYTQNSL